MGRLAAEDITQIIKIISATYPYAFKDIKAEEDIKAIKALWLELLSEYPKELVIKAFHNCLKTERVNIVPANIIEQIEKTRSAFEPSEQELWQELIAVLNKAQRHIDRFNYTYIEENGKTQGENAREQLVALYEGLKPEFKRYCGGASGLIELAEKDDESLEFERPRFLKDIKRKQEQVRTQEQYPALGEMVKIKGLLEG